MAVINLRLADQPLAQPARARVREGGIDLEALPLGTGTATGQGIAALGGQVAAYGAAMLEEQRKLNEAAAKAAAAAAASHAMSNMRNQMADLAAGANSEPAKARQNFMDGAEEAAQAEAARLPEDARPAFLARAHEMATARGPQVQADAAKALQADGTRALNDAVGGAVADAAHARNPVEEAEARARADSEISDAAAAGLLSPQREDMLRRRFPLDVAKARAKGLIRLNPLAAPAVLADPEQHSELDPADRVSLLAEADAAASQAVMQQAASDRMALASGYAAAHADADSVIAFLGGDHTAAPADLTGVADLVSPVVMDAARAAMASPAAADDPGAASRLLALCGSGDVDAVREQAAAGVVAGRITPGTMARAVKEAGEFSGPGATVWRAARERVATGLEVDALGAWGERPEIASLAADAMAEVAKLRRAMPDATSADAHRQAEAVTRQYRVRMAERVARELPPPPGLGGAGPYTPEALDDATGWALEDLDHGAATEEETARRLGLIEAWRWVVTGLEGEESR